MAVSSSARQRILDTIASICTIKTLDYYYVGYTRKSATMHATDATRIEFPFHVVLADKLTQSEAIDPEEFIFKAVTQNR